MEYPKINSLWKRGVDKKLLTGDYSEPEYGNIFLWEVSEKIDGTNIRIICENDVVIFGGRTKDSQIPSHLLDYLMNTFSIESFKKNFEFEKQEPNSSLVLYGEGYGPKIQKGGGNYRSDAGFILFDIRIGDWWLTRESVVNVAEKFEIPYVPYIGLMNKEEVVEFVKYKPKSLCSLKEQVMEGVVCRSYPLMLHRNRRPIMWKLKVCDFE